MLLCAQARRQPDADPNRRDSECANPVTLAELGCRGIILLLSIAAGFENSGEIGRGIEISRTCSPVAHLIRAPAGTQDIHKSSSTAVSIRGHLFELHGRGHLSWSGLSEVSGRGGAVRISRSALYWSRQFWLQCLGCVSNGELNCSENYCGSLLVHF